MSINNCIRAKDDITCTTSRTIPLVICGTESQYSTGPDEVMTQVEAQRRIHIMQSTTGEVIFMERSEESHLVERADVSNTLLLCESAMNDQNYIHQATKTPQDSACTFLHNL